MSNSTRHSGRNDLRAGYGKLGELAVPANEQIVDLATLSDHVVLTVDGIRLDAVKVLSELASEEMQHILQASPHDLLLVSASETVLFGQRTIPLRDLATNGKLYMGNKCFDLHLIETRLMGIRQLLEPKPTPVDLETLPADATVTLDNIVVNAHKLRQLALKKLTGTPAENRKFQLVEIDSAKDTGLYHNKVTLEHLSADDVYVIGAHEYERIEVEQLLIFNARKLSPKNILQRFTDSVKADWEGFKAEANAWYEKHPLLSKLLIVVLTASVAIRILKFTDLVDVIGRNMLGYMQESILDPNGNVATSVILGNSNMEVALGLIDLVFIAFGGYIGYRITRKSNKPLRNIPFGVLAGILVFRGVQLIVFVAFASTLH